MLGYLFLGGAEISKKLIQLATYKSWLLREKKAKSLS